MPVAAKADYHTMLPFHTMSFERPDLMCWLESAGGADIDSLPFGFMGFGADARVTRYNDFQVSVCHARRSNRIG